ncbi:hypothetical protein PIB30_013898 [Stylosanthes scabra]|uniref:Uncharacterized protein n=1 Tax=Stylosanthes scabra TaxID=79078 RepID=A0ABU6W4T6_9FABA|nr:hypothetical protein [Stylosanthes scabra]
MAGMLPGVECARRRRLYTNTTTSTNGVEGCSFTSTKHIHNDNSTRHPFSLYYPTNFESLMLSSPPSISQKEKRNVLKHEYLDEDMGGAAREAKQKLDDKFRERHSRLEAPKRKRPFWWFLVAYAPCNHQNTSSI